MFSGFVIIGQTEAGLESYKYCLKQLLLDCYWVYEKPFNFSAKYVEQNSDCIQTCLGFQLMLTMIRHLSWLEIKLPNMLFLDSYNKSVKVLLTLMHYRKYSTQTLSRG